MNLRRIIQAALVLASKEIMFHGTTDNNLRTILKKGLVFDKVKRIWEKRVEKKNEKWREEMESYPGVYFSSNFMASYSAAQNACNKFGGDPIIIVAQIETKTPNAVIDEDSLNLAYIWPHIDQSHLVLEALTNKAYYKDRLKKAWETFLRRVTTDIKHPKKMAKYFSLFSKVCRTYLIYKVARYEREELSFSSLKKYDEIIKGMDKDKVREEHRAAFDALLRKLNYLANKPEKERKEGAFTLHSVRVTEPVTYKGKNRILVVAQVYWGKKREDSYVKILYNKNQAAADNLIKSVKKNLGDWKVIGG